MKKLVLIIWLANPVTTTTNPISGHSILNDDSCISIISEDNLPLDDDDASLIPSGREMVNKYPLTVALWYTGGSIKSYKWSHQLSVVFTHYLPAYLVDGLLLVMGKKTL